LWRPGYAESEAFKKQEQLRLEMLKNIESKRLDGRPTMLELAKAKSTGSEIPGGLSHIL